MGRFTALVEGSEVDVSVYGRDASDAQLLAKTVRFLFYRDSGPTLALTRRQQVEHEAYLTLMAARAGTRVPTVLEAGPAGPAHDALLVTRPPAGNPLSTFASYVIPEPADAGGDEADPPVDPSVPEAPEASVSPPDAGAARGPEIGDAGPRRRLRPVDDLASGRNRPRFAVDPDHRGRPPMVKQVSSTSERRRRWPPPNSSTGTRPATLAAVADVAGPERALASAVRSLPTEALVGALPFLQRAALGAMASKSLRGKKAILTALREQGAEAAGVEVPKLIEPRRISWVTLVAGVRHPHRGLGSHRGPHQREQVVEHHHRSRLGLGGGGLRPGPGRLPGHRHHHGGLGHRPAPLRSDAGPRAVRHLRRPGRRFDGRAGHPGQVLPAGGVHAPRWP